jgi:hypothetical protein
MGIVAFVVSLGFGIYLEQEFIISQAVVSGLTIGVVAYYIGHR